MASYTAHSLFIATLLQPSHCQMTILLSPSQSHSYLFKAGIRWLLPPPLSIYDHSFYHTKEGNRTDDLQNGLKVGFLTSRLVLGLFCTSDWSLERRAIFLFSRSTCSLASCRSCAMRSACTLTHTTLIIFLLQCIATPVTVLEMVDTNVVDPYVFGPHRSGSFHHQAKIVGKILISSVLWLLYEFFFEEWCNCTLKR